MSENTATTTPIPTSQITLGYGGGAYININGGMSSPNYCWFLINSGSFTKTLNVPNFLAYNMDYDFNSDIPNVRNDVALGCGLVGFNGTLNFAITQSSLNKLFNELFINRNNVFDAIIYDGRKTLEIKCCYWNSFSISGSPRQVLSGSINFVSTNNQNENFNIYEGNPVGIGAYEGFSEKLIEYWNTGSKGVETFNLNFTREATPVYLNTKSNNPAYIRIGKINLTGRFSSWKNWFDTKEIRIANKKLVFKGEAVRDSADFNFQGIDDTGMHNYSIKLYNISNSSEFAWEIVDIK